MSSLKPWLQKWRPQPSLTFHLLHNFMRLPITLAWPGALQGAGERPGEAQTGVATVIIRSLSLVRLEGNHRHLKEGLPLLTVTASSPAASLFSTWELDVFVPTSPSRLEMCCSRDHILVIFLSSCISFNWTTSVSAHYLIHLTIFISSSIWMDG